MLHAAEIKVMLSAAFKEAYLELVPQFERKTGHKVTSLWVSSAQIMSRLKEGEVVDVVILSAKSLDELIRAGIIADRTDLATCGVAAAVRSGAPKPDLRSGEAVKRAVLAAKSIVYSRGPSGVYLEGLFERMAISDAIASKVKICQGEPAGALVARGAPGGGESAGSILERTRSCAGHHPEGNGTCVSASDSLRGYNRIMTKQRTIARQPAAVHGKLRRASMSKRVAVSQAGQGTYGDSKSGRYVLPSRDPRTGSYTSERSTKTLKKGSKTFASALKRLADK